MKNVFLSILVLTLVSFNLPFNELSKKDRQFAEKELVQSSSSLFAILDGLSPAQLQFKSSPKTWSIAECVEHITISESALFAMIRKSMTEPANKANRSLVKFSDKQIIQIMHDRSEKHKATALKSVRPTGKYGSVAGSLSEFKTKRDAHILFIQTTETDLRNHYKKMPFGIIDAFQLVIYMSAHTERHVAQIKEVMEHKDFPKS